MKQCLVIGGNEEPKDYKITYLEKEDYPTFRNENFKWIFHNLNYYPYPMKDNSFDLIICNNVLEHLSLYDKDNEYWIEFFNEIYRILKPNGKLTLTVPHFSNVCYIQHHHSFSCREFYLMFTRKDTWWFYLQKFDFNLNKCEIGFPKLNIPFGLFFNINEWTKELYEAYFAYIIRCQVIKLELEKRND